MYRLSARILVLAAALTVPAIGHAAPRDNAANQKIEQAVNELYLATEFDKAEALLKGVVEACEDRCSPGVKARAWMYVGIVRGSGKQDIAGAQEAFQQALALDPNVKLDDALATPPVRQAFADAAAALGQGVPAGAVESAETEEEGTGAPAGTAAPTGGMECTPDVRVVEAQRPIPVACTTDEPAVKVVLRYMAFGGETWQQVAMVKKGGTWQGEIPCADTSVTGKLKLYVQAKDKDGEELDSFGGKKQPVLIAIVGKTDEEPPSYPGQPPPQRCMSSSECPEDMIGTPACPGSTAGGSKGWGAPCDRSSECQSGLLCMQGDSGRTCETAPSCDTSSDCPSGAECRSGTCSAGDDEGDAAAGPYKKNWLGLHLGYDLVFMSGKEVCARGSSYQCYFQGDIAVDPGNVSRGGTLNGGIAPGTIRVLAAYERLITANLGLEGRLGFAFNGGPPAAGGGASFLPIHLEARGKLWPRKSSFASKGIRPYVFLGGGMAQVDAKLQVPIWYTQNGSTSAVKPVAYRKLGLTFIAGGGGAMYAIGKNHGPVLNLNMMFMLPESGFVLEPSLGYSLGL